MGPNKRTLRTDDEDVSELEEKPRIYDENDPDERADQCENAERFDFGDLSWNGPSD